MFRQCHDVRNTGCICAKAVNACRLAATNLVQRGVSTSKAVKRLASGSISNRVGKATAQDKAHAPSQIWNKCSAMPILLTVLIKETMHVIKTDSNKGMTKPA